MKHLWFPWKFRFGVVPANVCLTSTTRPSGPEMMSNSGDVHSLATGQRWLGAKKKITQELQVGVSKNMGKPPNHPIFIGVFIIFTIHFGVPLFLETSRYLKWRVSKSPHFSAILGVGVGEGFPENTSRIHTAEKKKVRMKPPF